MTRSSRRKSSQTAFRYSKHISARVSAEPLSHLKSTASKSQGKCFLSECSFQPSFQLPPCAIEVFPAKREEKWHRRFRHLWGWRRRAQAQLLMKGCLIDCMAGKCQPILMIKFSWCRMQQSMSESMLWTGLATLEWVSITMDPVMKCRSSFDTYGDTVVTW